MYPRNANTPPRIVIGAVVQISDGAVQSSGVSVVVRPEGGNETAGAGTVSYGGSSNVVYYTPTQGETNYTAFVVTAYKTGCLPISTTVITSAASVSGEVVTDTASRNASKATGFATPTNITAGTITTVTNLTNAPVNGDLTAAMKASVTGAVPNVGAIATAVWAAGTRTLSAIGDSPGITTLLGRITGLLQTKTQAEAAIATVTAKTDNLPATPAAVGSAMTLTSDYDAAKTAAQPGDVSPTINFSPTVEPTPVTVNPTTLDPTAVAAIQDGLATQSSVDALPKYGDTIKRTKISASSSELQETITEVP